MTPDSILVNIGKYRRTQANTMFAYVSTLERRESRKHRPKRGFSVEDLDTPGYFQGEPLDC